MSTTRNRQPVRGRGCVRVSRLVLAALALVPLACTTTVPQANPSSSRPTSKEAEQGQSLPSGTVPGLTGEAKGDGPAPRVGKSYDSTLRQTVKSLERYWGQQLPNTYTRAYEPLRGGIYAYSANSTIPPCGGYSIPYLLLQKNAFYCPDNDFIAWDDQALFPTLQEKYGTFLLAIVLAHEWGHAVQSRSGANLWGVAAEQQADCFAGAWAAQLGNEDRDLAPLRDRELDRALTGLIEFRDQVGATANDAGAHGSAFDRIRALQEGYEGGPTVCAGYEESLPTLIAVPYRDFKERFRGGNLPFEQVVTATETSLGAFWAANLGSPGMSEPATSLRPSPGIWLCEGSISPQGLAQHQLSWCEGQNGIRYSERELRKIYDEIGDVGVGTALAIQWAQVERIRNGADASSKSAYLESVCIAGAYLGSLYDSQIPEQSQLSPGDMDEGVQLVLRLAATGERKRYGSGFEQVAAFRRGALNTAASCAPVSFG